MDWTLKNYQDLINADTWNLLSPDSRVHLSTLLPPTAFLEFQPSIGPDHPASTRMDATVRETSDGSDPVSGFVDPSLFTDPHFLAAAHTFQDHIFSGWLTESHLEKFKRYEQGVMDGSLAAPWKDEVWEKENHDEEEEAGEAMNGKSLASATARAGSDFCYFCLTLWS